MKRLLAEREPDCEVIAFGSRVHGKAKPYSDLDLAIRGAARLSIARLAALKEAFEESELTIRVDILDWQVISPEFRAVIEAGYEIIQSAPSRGQSPSP